MSVAIINSPEEKETILKILHDIKDGHLPASSKPMDLREIFLPGEDLSGMDLSGVDFSGSDLTGTNLSRAKLFQAKFRGAILINVNLSECELTGADLTDADLENADISHAGLGMACLKGARLFHANMERSTLSKADLRNVDLRVSSLRGARIREADLSGADLTGSDLQEVDFALSNVSGATFQNSDLRRSRLRAIEGFEEADWIGVDIRDINFAGAYQMRRFIIDQNYLKEFRERNRLSKLFYWVWWVTSDCGRSVSRWCVCITILVLFFGWLYSLVGVDYGKYQTIFSSFYYSVVTLTALGYGDVIPASTASQFIAMIEVVTGYVMLGGLLSIFNNKMARRGD